MPHASRLLLVGVLFVCSAMPGASAGEFWLSVGSGFAPGGGLEAWQAVTGAPLGDLDSPGPRLRAFLSETGGDNSAVIESGWSFREKALIGDVLVGVEMRQQADRKRLSPLISAAFEAHVGPGGISGLAMLRPAFDEVWAELRPWFSLGDCWKLGMLAASAPAPDATGFRAGVFTSGYRVALPVVQELFLGAELGVESDSRGVPVTPYAGINLGFGF
jgi:hypothetical protein